MRFTLSQCKAEKSHHQLLSTFYQLIKLAFLPLSWLVQHLHLAVERCYLHFIVFLTSPILSLPWICCLHLPLCFPPFAANHYSAVPFPWNFPTSRSSLVWASTGLFSWSQYATLCNNKGFLKKKKSFLERTKY